METGLLDRLGELIPLPPHARRVVMVSVGRQEIAAFSPSLLHSIGHLPIAMALPAHTSTTSTPRRLA